MPISNTKWSHSYGPDQYSNKNLANSPQFKMTATYLECILHRWPVTNSSEFNRTYFECSYSFIHLFVGLKCTFWEEESAYEIYNLHANCMKFIMQLV